MDEVESCHRKEVSDFRVSWGNFNCSLIELEECYCKVGWMKGIDVRIMEGAEIK